MVVVGVEEVDAMVMSSSSSVLDVLRRTLHHRCDARCPDCRRQRPTTPCARQDAILRLEDQRAIGSSSQDAILRSTRGGRRGHHGASR